MSSSVDPKPAEDVGEENEEIKSSEGALERSEMFLDAAIDRSINTRAKLYVHTIDSNEWTDRGTGNAVTLSEKNDDSKLFVHFSNEKDRKICYDWPVEEDMDFSRSQGTIIMFAPTDEYQASLSFQTEEGADIFWKGLCRHLGRDPTNLDQFSPNSSDDEGFLDTPAAVPPIKLGTLSEIARIVTQAQGVNAMKDRIATILVKNNWLIALKNLYDITADLEDGYSLALISSIVRSLLMLNRDDIIEHLFDKGNLRIVFELLSHVHGENHPMDHVKFLYETAGMKHVIRITDEDKERIQKAYRIQYLMDFILPPRLSSMVLMEDSWIVSIESYMAVLRSNILNGIMKGASFKSEVITSLESPILADSHRRNLTLFLKEFFKMADNQAITPIEKRRILMNLMELGILRMIKPSLRSNDYTIKKITVEIMLSLAAHDTKDLLKFIVEDAKSITEPSILSELAQIFVHDSDPETQLAEAVFQLIRTLIDNEDHGVENSMDQKHFVSLFFRNHFRQVLQPLIDNVEGGTLKKDTYHTSRKANITISLASFFVEHHASVAVRHLTSVDISKSIVATIGSKHPSLVLASLKFMKTVVVLNDEKYTQHLVADGILILMVSIFCQKYKYSNNLYNSTFLSFFDAVKKRDDIVQHIMENYHTDFEDLTYCQVFTDFKQTYRHYLHLRDLSGKPINYGPTRSREDRVKEYDFPDDEAESAAPLPESKFRPRPLPKQEDEGALTTRTVTARPPTPMRIVLKASRLAPAGPTAEDGDKENKESAEPIKIEQIRLVDYDDSDNDSSSDREDENEANPVPTGDDQPEQRGKKRKAFEEGETPGTANQPKRSFEL